MDLKQLVGRNLKELRQKRKFTQKALAEAVGITKAGIKSLEEGRRWPRAETWAAICKALEVNVTALLEDVHGELQEPITDREIVEKVAAAFGFNKPDLVNKK